VIVGILKLELYLTYQPNSLKAKRHFIKSLKDRIWNKFRVSVAEVDDLNLWQKAVIGVSFVTEEKKLADQLKEKILSFIDNFDGIEVVSDESEMINY
jgi:uncharacterized protein